MQLPKGWTYEHGIGTEVLSFHTLPRGSMNGVGIRIVNYSSRKEPDKHVVTTDGFYLYQKHADNMTLSQAKDFALRLMKYINYGRFVVKVLDEKNFR